MKNLLKEIPRNAIKTFLEVKFNYKITTPSVSIERGGELRDKKNVISDVTSLNKTSLISQIIEGRRF